MDYYRNDTANSDAEDIKISMKKGKDALKKSLLFLEQQSWLEMNGEFTAWHAGLKAIVMRLFICPLSICLYI